MVKERIRKDKLLLSGVACRLWLAYSHEHALVSKRVAEIGPKRTEFNYYLNKEGDRAHSTAIANRMRRSRKERIRHLEGICIQMRKEKKRYVGIGSEGTTEQQTRAPNARVDIVDALKIRGT